MLHGKDAGVGEVAASEWGDGVEASAGLLAAYHVVGSGRGRHVGEPCRAADDREFDAGFGEAVADAGGPGGSGGLPLGGDLGEVGEEAECPMERVEGGVVGWVGVSGTKNEDIEVKT